MGIQIIGPGGFTQEVNQTLKSARTTQYPIEALGFYRMSVQSGLITTIAAGTATAGHLFAFRNASTTLVVPIYIGVKWRTVTAFTAAQEVGMELVVARSYTASHTAGTAIVLTGNNGKKRTSYPTSVISTSGDARIATTAALTAGTHTLDDNSVAQDQFAELATGAAVQKGRMDIVWDMTNGQDAPLILAQNEGFVLRNKILMGAGGTARVSIEIQWAEATAYP